MAGATVHLTLTREQVRRAVADLPGLFSGRVPDPTGMVSQVLDAIGLEFLGLIKEAYEVKAKGGTDAAGIRWPPLKPATIAYNRRHPGLPPSSQRGPRYMLSKDQDDEWKLIFARTYRYLRGKGLSDGEAKGNAAGHAWLILKSQGAKTLLSVYGNMKVKILKDTGAMFGSLSHAIVAQGTVAVGSNDVKLPTHHFGNPAKGIPKRAIWPEPDQVPDVWVERIMDVLSDGVEAVFRRALGAP